MEFIDGTLTEPEINFKNAEDSKKFRVADYLLAVQCIRPRNKITYSKISHFSIFNPINDVNDLRIVAEILKLLDIENPDKNEIIRSADLFVKYPILLQFEQPVFKKDGLARRDYECRLELIGTYGNYIDREKPSHFIMSKFQRALEKCGVWNGSCYHDIIRFKVAYKNHTTKEMYEKDKQELKENIEGLGFKIVNGILFEFGINFINKKDSEKFRMADYLLAMQCVRPRSKLVHYKFSQFDIFNPINNANDLRIVAEILKLLDINGKDKDEIIRSADLFDKYGVFLYFKQPVFYKNGTARQNYECHLELLGRYGEYATRNRPPRCIMNKFLRVLEKCGDWNGSCNSDIARFKLADSKITTKEEYEENKRKLIENIEGLGFKIFTNI